MVTKDDLNKVKMLIMDKLNNLEILLLQKLKSIGERLDRIETRQYNIEKRLDQLEKKPKKKTS